MDWLHLDHLPELKEVSSGSKTSPTRSLLCSSDRTPVATPSIHQFAMPSIAHLPFQDFLFYPTSNQALPPLSPLSSPTFRKPIEPTETVLFACHNSVLKPLYATQSDHILDNPPLSLI